MLRSETKENLMAWGLAAIGALRSLPELIDPHPETRTQTINKIGPGKIAWGGLLTTAIAYDALAPKGHTLSEEVDRGIDKHQLATRVAIAATALHLMNWLPNSIDPIHQVGKRARAKIHGT